MQKVKAFFIANRSDIIWITFLFAAFAVMTSIFSNGYWGDFIFDNGREAYLPAEVLKGKVLYKDIFNYFGPFSYQLNAFLYSIFGVKLSTLYLAGCVNSIVILFCTWFITRFFTTKTVSYLVTSFIMFACVFKSLSAFNYVFPYSYAMVYALSTFLLSVLFLIFYLKTSKPFFVPLSWFFIGVSIASKYEFVFYVLFLAVITFFIKPVDKKHFFLSVFLFLITSVICFSTLFLQGLTLNDLVNLAPIIKRYSLSESLSYFYHFCGLYPNKYLLELSGVIFLKFVGAFLPFLASVYFLLVFINENRGKFTRLLYIFLLTASILAVSLFFIFYHGPIFSFLPILATVFFLVFVFVQLKNNAHFLKTNKMSEIKKSLALYISTYDGIYATTVIIALLACVKVFFFFTLSIYGTFFLPLIFIVSVVFLFEYIPRFFKKINETFYRSAVIVVLATIAFLYFALSLFNLGFYYETPLEKNGNKMYISAKNTGKSFKEAFDYINKNLKPSDSFIVFPEGVMLNFLTGHPTNDIYFTALMPPHIEAFGEDKIIEALKKEPPDYIFIHNFRLHVYRNAITCGDSGLTTCGWIYDNYSKEKTFDGEFQITIYKNNKK